MSPPSALRLRRGVAPTALVSTSAQLSSSQVRASIPIPPGGGVATAIVCPIALKRHRRSCPGCEPPTKHSVFVQAVEVTSGDTVAGGARGNQ